jgi:diguanylate cyclase (GGDEF)-like protein
LGHTGRFIKGPVFGFGICLLVLTWFGCYKLISTERDALRRLITHETANLAIIVDQNISRSVNGADGLLRLLRQTYVRQGYQADWARLTREEHTLTNERFHIAVIDAQGMMITSTAGPIDAPPLYLGDREHFLFHVKASRDELFLSKPVFGRVSKKWAIQLTRRLIDGNGAFAGVIVVSLDPDQLTRMYGNLKLERGGGLAVIGIDGIVRAGAGIYQGRLGRGFQEGSPISSEYEHELRAGILFETFNEKRQLVAVRSNERFPLSVAVAAPDVDERFDWQLRKRNYFAIAFSLSSLIIAAMIGVDISRRRYEKKIEDIAHHDVLTGLANRALFREEIQRAIAGSVDGQEFALHLIDLDGFKQVNDTHGHPFGDALLRAVSERLRSNLRHIDFAARLGGDEFAIIQAGVRSDHSASALAERVCRVLAESYEIEGSLVSIGASAGIALSLTDGRDMSDLLKAADLALYAAKADGRGRYRFYSQELDAKAEARRQIEAGLKLALINNELVVHYQPIVAIETSEPIAYEALVRWQHPERGLVPPIEFITIAEETGLIVRLGEYVLRQSCIDMAARCGNARIAVNISPVQFRDPDLIVMIRDALRTSRLAPDRLEIEITESTLMRKDDRTIAHLQDLRALGVKIAMDDFGTGYSSLSYLQTYPIDCIKIDRSFVMTLGESGDASAIVRAITTLATSLGMTTVAEGVETKQQRDTLQALGCTKAQGYYFGRPLPAADALPPLAGSVVIAA